MSADGIDALLRKREELLAQIQGMQSAIFHIDQALSLIGYSKTTVARRFANGELMRLIGEAERACNQPPTRILPLGAVFVGPFHKLEAINVAKPRPHAFHNALVEAAMDAYERTTMVLTYLALAIDGKVSDQERHLVLQSLFRPTADGLVKDDASIDSNLAALSGRVLPQGKK